MSTIFRTAVLTLASAATLFLSSCATTGDPSTGGIFWSENKAQDRLHERQQNLENIERKTGQTQSQSTATQRKIDSLSQ